MRTFILLKDILHQLIWRIYHYLQGFIYLSQVVGNGIPSINISRCWDDVTPQSLLCCNVVMHFTIQLLSRKPRCFLPLIVPGNFPAQLQEGASQNFAAFSLIVCWPLLCVKHLAQHGGWIWWIWLENTAELGGWWFDHIRFSSKKKYWGKWSSFTSIFLYNGWFNQPPTLRKGLWKTPMENSRCRWLQQKHRKSRCMKPTWHRHSR